MGLLGGKQDVTHENSHEIQGVAKFAVEEISKQTNASLELVRVVEAHKQVVNGLLFELKLKVSGGSAESYKATVYQPPGGAKTLDKFEEV
ncbi:hypothetical protein KFL_003330060 [Klebsormidium nitens]|uniref:Cysteine proteinase inhibitor n=1 Tax=Klebsormidium nitens TaxID=105231 RepID=A0A1Y1I828_KLENI|nr:hypothetical protein KFL_003330060 [Klebsormidium nitens]|eukprot:GAQ87125.1 hypothetical protein KFL_003330060 [Klebsormidium nitens]